MSFEARYAGPCAHGDRITAGDLVEYDEDDDLVHVECKAVDGMSNIHARVCPDCRLEHAGECD